MTQTAYQVGRQIRRAINGHDIVLSVGVDCYAVAVWIGPSTRLDAWGHTYADFDAAVRECRRIRSLIETHGSLQAVEDLADALTAELHIQQGRARHHSLASSARGEIRRIEEILDTLRTTADLELLGQLVSDVTEFLAAPLAALPAVEPIEEASTEVERPTLTVASKPHHMSDYQISLITYALTAGDGTIRRGRGQGSASIRTLVALARRGYAELTGPADNPTGARITAAGARRAAR